MNPRSLILIAVLALPVLPQAESRKNTGTPPMEPAPASIKNETPKELLRRAKNLQKRDKKSAEPWLLRGKAYHALGRHRKALKSFAKALKRDPLSAEAYYRRGRIFEEKKKQDEAANEYQAALKANPSHEGARKAWDALSVNLAEASEK